MSTTMIGSHSRAARLHLITRLELARHAVDLLHSKEQALQRERARLDVHAERAHDVWERAADEAATWLQRARALGSTDELHVIVAEGPQPAEIEIDWQTSMGIAYPGDVRCTPAVQPDLTASAALAPATRAHHRALDAAATHGATRTALARLDAELATTRRRRRAIGDRLVPRLEDDLRALEIDLDEQDREEALRVRLAGGQQTSTRHNVDEHREVRT
jgi:vacuolar-type H+-ATPase subunit D/Vma8